MSTGGTKVYYITGNHDDRLRTFSEISLGNIHLRDKLLLQFNNEKYWIFHGDVFDTSVKILPLIAKMGGKGYDLLIRINRWINHIREKMGKPKMSFSKKVKSRVKQAAKFISDFENLAVNLGAKHGYDYVVCGHIHEAANRQEETPHGPIRYLNSGDWVESLTSLEYENGTWSIFNFMESALYDGFEVKRKVNKDMPTLDLNDTILKDQNALVNEFMNLINN